MAGAEMIELFSINSSSSCHLWRVTPSNEMSSHRHFGRRGGRDRVSGIGILEKTLIRQHLTQHREVIPAAGSLGQGERGVHPPTRRKISFVSPVCNLL
jgi:hypothetical protein